MKHLTIFTPTYNRAYILNKLYESLCVQTCQDFEWLIVDDGSTDNTKELVDTWMGEGRIAIRYVYQQNGGKQRAFNKAVALTNSELFVCIDSDDQLTTEHVVEESLALLGCISRGRKRFLESCRMVAFIKYALIIKGRQPYSY